MRLYIYHGFEIYGWIQMLCYVLRVILLYVFVIISSYSFATLFCYFMHSHVCNFCSSFTCLCFRSKYFLIYLFVFSSLSDSTFFLLSFHSSSLVLLACFLKGKTMKEKMYGWRKREFGVKEKEIRKSVERKIKLLRFIFQI